MHKIGERVKFVLEADNIHRKGKIVDYFRGKNDRMIKYKIDTGIEIGWFYVLPSEVKE